MYKALLRKLDEEGNKEAAKAIRELQKQTEPRYFALVMESKMISGGHCVIHQIKAFKTLSQIKSFVCGSSKEVISLKVDEYGLTEMDE